MNVGGIPFSGSKTVGLKGFAERERGIAGSAS